MYNTPRMELVIMCVSLALKKMSNVQVSDILSQSTHEGRKSNLLQCRKAWKAQCDVQYMKVESLKGTVHGSNYTREGAVWGRSKTVYLCRVPVWNELSLEWEAIRGHLQPCIHLHTPGVLHLHTIHTTYTYTNSPAHTSIHLLLRMYNCTCTWHACS